MNTESHPLIRQAYAIVDGIPSNRIKLSKIATHRNPNNSRTVACPAGWIAMHPMFMSLGLDLKYHKEVGYILTLPGETDKWWDQILSQVFNIPVSDAARIFGPRGHVHDFTNTITYTSDKEVWQRRVHRFLGISKD